MSEHGVTRRELVGTAAARTAGLMLPQEAAEARRRRRRRRRGPRRKKADVVVVGAGFAGLTAAREIVRAGRSVIVLEARKRVGGRALNKSIGGGEISERGATFVGPTQNHIIALGKEFGVGTFPTYVQGENVYVADGERTQYSDTGPTGSAPPDPRYVADLAQIVTRGNEMAATVPVDAPWTAPNAVEWDNQTLETWIKNESANDRFREIVLLWTRPAHGAELRELSLLFTAYFVAASGDEQHVGTFERNFNTRGGAQELRFHGGAQRIALRLARQLGRRVVLRSPVTRIAQSGRAVRVESKRVTARAKHVIVAIPPPLAARIDYRPILPPDRDQLTQRFGMGTLIKAAAIYDRAFWRDKGMSGTAVSLDGPVSATFDDSPENGRPGVIFGFIGGDKAREHTRRSPAERKRVVIERYVQFFGNEAARPIDYFETNWAREKWTRGAPTAIAGPGTLLAYGPALRQPFGRIHWAGTETSDYWNGYMDGAVRSGKRAAREVLARL